MCVGTHRGTDTQDKDILTKTTKHISFTLYPKNAHCLSLYPTHLHEQMCHTHFVSPPLNIKFYRFCALDLCLFANISSLQLDI